MTLPEGVQPSGPTVSSEPAVETTVTEDPMVTEPVAEDDPTTVVDESASDAELRAWAKENGIEGVPASGRLSASWRDQITAAMAAALDPKEEDSVADTSSPESSTSSETMTTTEPVQPEFETGEYRSVFKAPNTFMSSQAFTA